MCFAPEFTRVEMILLQFESSFCYSCELPKKVHLLVLQAVGHCAGTHGVLHSIHETRRGSGCQAAGIEVRSGQGSVPTSFSAGNVSPTWGPYRPAVYFPWSEVNRSE